MDVSIIIINYKTPDLCAECINSIFEKTKDITYEIIVIDNNSGDNSVNILRERFADDIILLESQTNLGTTKANNLAAKNARGEYLLFLNSDTKLINNYVELLKNYLDNNIQVGAVGGNFYDVNYSPAHSFRRHYDLKYLKKEACFLKYIVNGIFKKKISEQFNYSKKDIDVAYICCAGMLIRKNIFDELGGFDEDIFMYGEEPILCAKIKKAGYRCVNIPNAKLQHLEGASFKRDSANLKFDANREERILAGTRIFFDKYYGNRCAFDKYLKYTSKIYYNYSIIKRLQRKNIEANYYKNLAKYYKARYKNETV